MLRRVAVFLAVPIGLVALYEGYKWIWETAGFTRPFVVNDRTMPHTWDMFARLAEPITGATNAQPLWLAVMLAALGLFGLAAFTAERRTKEIGIRKSMGATRTDILRLLLWQFARPVLWANLIAWPAAYFAMRRWLDGFAYRIELETG